MTTRVIRSLSYASGTGSLSIYRLKTLSTFNATFSILSLPPARAPVLYVVRKPKQTWDGPEQEEPKQRGTESFWKTAVQRRAGGLEAAPIESFSGGVQGARRR